MRNEIRSLAAAALLAVLAGCATARPARQAVVRDTVVTVTILQLNDVYEIMPLGGSGFGGLARVATLRQTLARENPNTFVVLAGDVLSPSAMSSARAGADGSALNGQHMVDLLNHAGLGYATFGNHEFDLRKADFDKRMQESKFTWFSSNVLGADGQPLPNTPAHVVLTATNASGRQLRIGMFGLTIDSNAAAYVRYRDPHETALAQVADLKGKSDIIVALTHLAFQQDERLAETVPGLSLILGGHEHQNLNASRGAGFVPVLKADSNAKSAYVHRLRYDTQSKRLDVDSDLVAVNDQIAEDPAIAALARGWRDKAFAAFRKDGLDPDKTVATLTEILDGRESAVRNGTTNLTAMILAALLDAQPGAQGAIFNSGSIRIDDTLGPGAITQYDVLRVLPYRGELFLAGIKGSMLTRILAEGRGAARKNTGGFLQVAGFTASPDGIWTFDGKPLDPNATYRIVMNDYLLNGNERGLEFIRPGAEIQVLNNPPKEFRLAVIEKLQKGATSLSASRAR